jgi:hypothetical protein
MNLAVVTDGFYQGTLHEDKAHGRSVNVVLNLKHPDQFYQYVLDQFNR